MNKICTSLEQSKKLMELGIDVNTADMCWTNHCYSAVRSSMTIAAKTVDEYKSLLDRFNDSASIDVFIPAWSLSALLELIPKHIKQEDGKAYKFHIFNDDGRVIQRWGCSYVAEDYHNRAEYLSDPTLKYPTNVYSGKYDNPLDAAFEMVCWLLENKKI